jgi:hypothetical protein
VARGVWWVTRRRMRRGLRTVLAGSTTLPAMGAHRFIGRREPERGRFTVGFVLAGRRWGDAAVSAAPSPTSTEFSASVAMTSCTDESATSLRGSDPGRLTVSWRRGWSGTCRAVPPPAPGRPTCLGSTRTREDHRFRDRWRSVSQPLTWPQRPGPTAPSLRTDFPKPNE